MKKIAILSLVAILATSCNAQDKTKKDIAQNDSTKSDKEMPQSNWSVNKEVDENGNIVKYDSIYSWSSANDLKGLNQKQTDSVLQNFESTFSTHFSSSIHQDFSSFFDNDSLFMKQFFNDDVFKTESAMGFPDMEKIRKQMQQMQQQFKQRQKSIIPALPEESEKKN